MDSFSDSLLLNCDWLGLSLQIAGDPRPIDGYQWREYSATNVWAKRRVLWTDEGDRVLTLLSEPRSTVINSRAALLEIENEWLYHGGGFRKILDLLTTSVFYTITGISRVDLAVDFSPTEAQKEVICGLGDGSYYVGGKSNRVPWYAQLNSDKLSPMWNHKNVPYDQSWGHKTTDIKWKLYYKSKELLDAGGGKFFMKPYIVDQWRLNGLDVSNVWRVEVSVKKCNNYSLYGERITIDNLERNFHEFFLQLYDSRFQIKLNEGHKDRSNDKRVSFLDVRKINYTMQRRQPSNERQRNGRITLLRHLVQSLEDEQVLLDRQSRFAVYEHMQKIIERDNLENYFFAMTGYWWDEYITVMDNKANGSEVKEIDRPMVNADIKPNVNAEIEDKSTALEYWKSIGGKVERDLHTAQLKNTSGNQTKLDLLP